MSNIKLTPFEQRELRAKQLSLMAQAAFDVTKVVNACAMLRKQALSPGEATLRERNDMLRTLKQGNEVLSENMVKIAAVLESHCEISA